MPATTTKRCSVWTGCVDCGKDTLMLSLMNDNYVIDIVQLSGIYGSKPPSPRATARGRGLFTLLESKDCFLFLCTESKVCFLYR